METPTAETLESKMSDYEKTREERIKQNLERMQKLGIFDLSLKLKSVKPIRNNNFNSKPKTTSISVPSPGPARRSSRLQNTGPVSYCELRPEKENNTSSKRRINIYTEGSKPEEYTDEHEKLLGSTEKSWTLFVDGYGKNGKRIYDCVQGKTCHQCRQKTLGHRTHCSKCEMVQGQFCGDCLYMRYGEHVLEAKQNPDWICPVCRGICNCSLCRQAKGWAPTGTMYKKITQLGFKSVAHYLIQTRRAKAESADNNIPEPDSEVPTSEIESVPIVEIKPNIEVDKNIEAKADEVNDTELLDKEDENISINDEDQSESSIQNAYDDELKGKEEEICLVKMEDGNNDVAGETSGMSKRKKSITCEANTDTVAGRLRQRRRIEN